MREAEYKIRQGVVEALMASIKISCQMHNLNQDEALKMTRDAFKSTLKAVDLPYNLMTVRAMIEGAVYIKTAQKMANALFPAEMSYALLLLWEDELIKEKNEKLAGLDFGEKK